jgi:hypothetical protein
MNYAMRVCWDVSDGGYVGGPGAYSERAIAKRRELRKARLGCICPSHDSNRGKCPIHDAHGRINPCVTTSAELWDAAEELGLDVFARRSDVIQARG